MSAPRPTTSNRKCETVKVVVRCRPMSENEIKDGYERIVNMDIGRGAVELSNPKSEDEPRKTFTFDSIYDWDSVQMDVYTETVKPLVDSVLAGFNGTIFAYGQTGTGKTFTMEGVRNDEILRGIIPRSFDHIFAHIAQSNHDEQYLVRASYLEIYQEEIRDLLHKDQSKRLELKERPDIGVYVKDLSSFVTKSVQEIQHVMSVGNGNRSVASTDMNERSSRSHAIFMITIECSSPGVDGKSHIRVGRLNLVDLAGSERQGKAGTTGERFKEGTKINLSLSALGNVISALVDGKSSHVPYRDSKLTRLLQDSLGGNARTIMVANIGPASYNYEETLSTLRYANRAKNIQNKPKINEDPKDALLREFQEEISRLRALVEQKGKRRRGSNADSETASPSSDNERRLEAQRQAIMASSTMIDEQKEKLIAEIDEKVHEYQKQQQAQQQLIAKIHAMESKLLNGQDFVSQTTEQERELEKKRIELTEQKRKEREMLQKLETQEESTLEIQRTYKSLAEEVEVKTRKLKKIYTKLQQYKIEMRDLSNEHSTERQDLENLIMQLTKDLKLRYLIIDNFVPIDARERIESRCTFDEENDVWKLQPLDRNTINDDECNYREQRPVSTTGSRSPVSDFTRLGAAMFSNGEKAYRYRNENILTLKPLAIPRLTLDYVAPQVDPQLQEALDDALNDEKDHATLLVNASNVRRTTSKNSIGAHTTTTTISQRRPGTGGKIYPKSRGLV